MVPRWPVRSSTTARAFGMRRAYSDDPSTGTTWSRPRSPVTISVGALMRSQSGPRSMLVDEPGSRGHARERNRRARARVRNPSSAKRRRARGVGNRGADLGPHPQRRLGEEDRAEDPRRAQVDLMAAAQPQPRLRRRRQDQGAAAVRVLRREPHRDQAAERDAADRRALDALCLQCAIDLRRVAVEVVGVQREGEHAEARRERIDGPAHVFPPALKAGYQHEWRSAAAVNDLHRP